MLQWEVFGRVRGGILLLSGLFQITMEQLHYTGRL
jgi:hypothetical protein